MQRWLSVRCHLTWWHLTAREGQGAHVSCEAVYQRSSWCTVASLHKPSRTAKALGQLPTHCSQAVVCLVTSSASWQVKTLATPGLIESDKAWRCRFQANCKASAELQHQAVTCLHQAVTWLHDARQLATAVTDPFVKQPVFYAGGMFQSPV